MKYQKESSRIDRIISVAEFGRGPSEHGIPEPYRHFGGGPNSILFEGNSSLNVYENEIEMLFNSNRDIVNSYTFEKFENEIVNLIRELKVENRKCKPADLETLFNNLLAEELRDYEILNEVWGVEMQSAKINFGEFTIYHFLKSRNELIAKYPSLSDTIFTEHIQSSYLIGITIKAREQKKAVEKAHAYFSTFENAFNYMLADLSHRRQFSIFGFRNPTTMSSIVCNNETMGKQSKKLNTLLKIQLEHEVFTDPFQGNNFIWELITKSDKSDIERRILNSIEWIGKAITEKEMPKSLIQFVFAVEGMLQYDEGTFITPSIISQLSDWLAFIINDDQVERKKIASYFKDVYRKRSAIAHGAKKNIKEEDLYLALNISKLMIISFLTYEPLKKIKTVSELNNYMIDLKFK